MNKDRKGSLYSSILELGKIKISIPVALTGFLGYYRFSTSLSPDLVYTLLGILLLSMGSSTFNQVQEHRTDKLMKRTKSRPIPSGKISVRGAALAGTVEALVGLGLLLLTGSVTASLIGIFTMCWYNLVYTPLKRVTPFAVLPGALIGALPPLIGWAAAGGNIFEREIIIISFFLFIGQMPHYWLILMKVGDEFRDAGLPVITNIFTKSQLRNISFIWILAAAVTVIMFPASGIIQHNWLAFSMLGLILLFLVRMTILSFKGEIMENWRKAFMTVNLFYLFIILLLIGDKFSSPYLY